MPMSPRLLRPRQSGVFDPRTIADLSVWMTMTDSSTYSEDTADSGRVSQWRSKVGTLAFNQASVTNNMPTLYESSGDAQNATRAVINGRQALYFDGTNDVLTGSATLSETQYTVFLVVRVDSLAAIRGAFTRDPASGSRGPQYMKVDTSGVGQSIAFSTSSNATASTIATMSTGVGAVYHAVQTSDTLRAFLNNSAGNSVSITQRSVATTPRIGYAAVAVQYWLGTIGEILLYSRALSATEQTTVYTYLSKTWGIA